MRAFAGPRRDHSLTVREVTIYTDGSCHGNPGPGGYAAILLHGKFKKELTGGFRLTTNNRMELLAAIVAFEALKESCKVDFYTDSTYVRNGLEKGWAENWRRNGWKKKKGKVISPDLWKRLLIAVEGHKIAYHWVKGHSGNPLNERCDELANIESSKGAKLPKDPGYPPTAGPDEGDLL